MAEGRDENLDTVLFGTPWSAPLNVEVRSDFRRHRPRPGLYLGRFTFGGTPLLNASTDPNPIRLLARRNRVEFAPASAFPRC